MFFFGTTCQRCFKHYSIDIPNNGSINTRPPTYACGYLERSSFVRFYKEYFSVYLESSGVRHLPLLYLSFKSSELSQAIKASELQVRRHTFMDHNGSQAALLHKTWKQLAYCRSWLHFQQRSTNINHLEMKHEPYFGCEISQPHLNFKCNHQRY